MISPGAFSVHSLMFNDGNSYALVVIGVTFSNLQTGTTPFHPQPDGATERVIRTANVCLQKW